MWLHSFGPCKLRRSTDVVCAVALTLVSAAFASGQTQVDHYNKCAPWHPHAAFPKLTTPQWVGEKGVDAVVVLAIDDMRDTARYESYLRPILERLKKIDGRAPVSIMTCSINPSDPRIKTWLKEGLSIEVHTVDHPCPLLTDGNIERAKSTYDRCIDLLATIPGTTGPVAYRMPCCDSLNTVSPRFFDRIFDRTTPKGKFLQISSSVFNIFTEKDSSIPRELLLDKAGKPRFVKYIPHKNPRPPRNGFINWIENYPYPYVINRTCWEFPCVVPSDWEAQNLHRPFNPITVADMKAALDITVHKKGVYNLVFHPHGWIRNDQVIDLIDHAVSNYGKRVKFLTFPEALKRLNKHLLGGHPLRDKSGKDNGVRLVDVNKDGYQDVIISNDSAQTTRLWKPASGSFQQITTPLKSLAKSATHSTQLVSLPDTDRLKVVQFSKSGNKAIRGWRFQDDKWQVDRTLSQFESRLASGAKAPVANLVFQRVTTDGHSIAIAVRGGDRPSATAYMWNAKPGRWDALKAQFPKEVAAALNEPHQPRIRFVDIDEDGDTDILVSRKPGAAPALSVWLMDWFATGKAEPVKIGTETRLMPFTRSDGSDNGFFVREQFLCWQNEDTNRLPNLLHRVSFDTLLHDHVVDQVSKGKFPAPKTPRNSASLIQVRPGLRVQLVAAEPLIQDPVAFDWDVTGRLWVVEMGGYPSGAKDGANGRIRVLSDMDGDGVFDQATTFLDKINYPNGIQLWRNGVLVTAAPEIFYAEDTDGDGKADVRRTLYRGFIEGNQQHRVNGLRWNLDNWLYVANGDSGGTIQSTAKSAKAVSISGRDFRIRPDEGLIDPQSGQTQFGRNRDDWGNWFGNNNSNPMWHYALADHYLRRNPHATVPNARHVVPEVPGAAPVFPISRTLPRYNDFQGVNRFTSACSTMIYRDRLLGDAFYGNAFTSEPVHNLISRLVISPNGSSFSGRRADDERSSEFLASRDNWFRPTMIRTGPDGALWFADMYRAVIEHPKWIPEEWQQRLDLRAGHNMGRIYRILPEESVACCGNGNDTDKGQDADSLRGFFKNRTPGIGELIQRLKSPNGWWRDTAHRLLIHRKDELVKNKRAQKQLLSIATTAGGDALPRVHALATLEGLGLLSASHLTEALRDRSPGVRRHAIRMSERLLPADRELAKAVASLINDEDPFVQVQLSYSAKHLPPQLAGNVISNSLARHGQDRWISAAAYSSIDAVNVSAVVKNSLEVSPNELPSGLVTRLISQAIAFGQVKAIEAPLTTLFDTSKKSVSASRWNTMATIVSELNRNVKIQRTLESSGIRQAVDKSIDTALTVIRNSDANELLRIAAADFIRGAGLDAPGQVQKIAELLEPQTPPALQQSLVAALATSNDKTIPSLLLQNWRAHSPSVRNAVLDALTTKARYRQHLIDSLENGTVAAVEIDAVRRQRLLVAVSKEQRAKTEKLLATSVNSDRSKIVQQHLKVLQLSGDISRGQKVFQKHCSVCHRLAGIGKTVGADLTSLRDRSGASLLTAILDPNRAVESKFLTFSAITTKGRTHVGMLLAETGVSLTLIGADGKPTVIRRSDLDRLSASNRSLMPDGFEKDLSDAQLADVIRFIQSTAKPRKKFAGNEPRTLTANANGEFRIPATAAEIFGPSIVLEGKYKNLGFWSSAEDHADWTIHVQKPGKYRVELDYAVQEGAAGDELHFAVHGQTLKGRVPSTGTWDDYRNWKLGVVELPKGISRIVVSTPVKPKSAMIDLRTIVLKPVEQ